MVKAGDIEKGIESEYNFIKPLGKGAFGEAWYATTGTGKAVVVKVYHSYSPKVLDDISHELEILKAITQGNKFCKKYSACLIDYYSVDNKPRIVMDYIPGPEFTDYIQKVPLSERTKRTDIIKPLVLGMNEYFKLGVTHQDLKEYNVMWDTTQKLPRYIDWGLACLKKYCDPDCVRPCGTSGTEYTMPPELRFGQYNQKTFDTAKAHDLWSLGVMLYDWYTHNQSNKVGIMRSNEYLYRQSEQRIKELIGKIPNRYAQKIISLLLVRNPLKRLDNWSKVLELVTNSPFDISKCDPAIDKKVGNNNLMVVKRNSNSWWCFSISEIIDKNAYNPRDETFTNIYTGNPEPVPAEYNTILYGVWSKKKKNNDEFFTAYQEQEYNNLVLNATTATDAAENYLKKVLNLPALVKKCNNKSWDEFLQEYNTAEKILPILLSAGYGYDTTDPIFDKLTPIKFDPALEQMWLFYANSFSPIVFLAAVFRFFEQSATTKIDYNQIPHTNYFLEDLYNDIFCVHLEEMTIVEGNATEICEDVLPDWVKDTENGNRDEMRANIAGKVRKLQIFPVDWHNKHNPQYIEQLLDSYTGNTDILNNIDICIEYFSDFSEFSADSDSEEYGDSTICTRQ